jgi:hypothetical protein
MDRLEQHRVDLHELCDAAIAVVVDRFLCCLVNFAAHTTVVRARSFRHSGVVE